MDSIYGWYRDSLGREWFCKQDAVSGTIVCDTRDGHHTACSRTTFQVWDWEKVE